MLDLIGKLLNRVNDWDLTWVGFRALRPAADQNMSARVVAVLCLVYCPLAGAIVFLGCLLLARIIVPKYGVHVRVPEHFPWIMGSAAMLAFLLAQSLLAYAWNRRAARLRADAQSKSTAS